MDPYIRDVNCEPFNTLRLNLMDDINDLHTNSNSQKFSIFHQNICSMNKNLDKLKIFLHQLSFTYDCIVLSETFSIHDCNLFHLEDYDLLYSEGNINKNDGVVVFIKSKLKYTYKIIPIGVCRAIQIIISMKNNTQIAITSIYKPPPVNEDEFLEHLEIYLNQTNKLKIADNILIGDININLKSNNDTVSNYLNIMEEYGFLSLINKSTRVCGSSKSCIDHLFYNSKTKNEKDIVAAVYETFISDHKAIFAFIPLFPKLKIQHDRTITHINYNNLRQDLQKHDWTQYKHLDDDDVDQKATLITKVLNLYIEKNTHSRQIQRKNIKRKQWITKGIINSIEKRNKLYKEFNKDRTDNAKKLEYLNYRAIVDKTIKAAKLNFYEKQITENKNSSKHLWTLIKGCGNKQNKELIEEIISEDGTAVKEPLHIANELNNFFCSVGEKLAEKIDVSNNPTVNKNQFRISNASFFLTPVTEPEIINLIKTLKDKKAPGIDKIKSEVIKKTSEIIAPYLVDLINSIFKTGQCPVEFKKAIITPLHKKGDKKCLSNYRPISLLSTISKIFEKSVKTRLSAYLNKYNILSKSQFGFRENFSTNDAIVTLVNQIYDSIDSAKPSICIFLDLARAFDTVSHGQLLEALEDVGIRGVPLSLFKSYLNDREQAVRIGNSVSNSNKINFGVPQGTVLGPILFSIYINNLFHLKTKGSIIGFADDTAIFYQGDTWQQLKELIEDDFKNISGWFDYKKLTINYEKTFFIPFCSYKNTLPEFTVLQTDKIGNKIIKLKNHIKYLGIIIDSHLKWDMHINNVTNNLRPLLYKLKYMKTILKTTHLKIVYQALVESRINYAITSWGSALKTHLKKLEIIQKKILKIIYNKDNTYPSDSLFKETTLLDIRQTYFLNVVLHIYKNNSIIHSTQHNYNTRYKLDDNIQIALKNKTIGQRSLSFLSIIIFNFLPVTYKMYLTTINSKGLFRSFIKSFILNVERSVVRSLIERDAN